MSNHCTTQQYSHTAVAVVAMAAALASHAACCTCRGMMCARWLDALCADKLAPPHVPMPVPPAPVLHTKKWRRFAMLGEDYLNVLLQYYGACLTNK